MKFSLQLQVLSTMPTIRAYVQGCRTSGSGSRGGGAPKARATATRSLSSSFDRRATNIRAYSSRSSTSSSAASSSSVMETKNTFFPPPPAPPSEHQPGVCDTEVWSALNDDRRRIYCNRSLNMASIQAVGFDMDYTLAQYKLETFEALAYRLTTEKLVRVFGYPKEVLDLQFDWKYMKRGLTIDKRRGNVLKLDRHKYVKVAYHGFKKLDSKERLQYHAAERTHSFDEHYAYTQIDTLFSLAEAYLFTQLVDMKDSSSSEGGILAEKRYQDIYADIRNSIDLSHRDGSLKTGVASNPGHYIHKDKNIVPLLEDLRLSGKKIFIVTNSLWDYTNIVMNYLIDGKTGADKDLDWLSYFEVVITGSAKPRFFNENQPLFQVETGSGALLNTDEGNPMVDLDSESDDSDALEPVPLGKVFQGGNYRILNRMLQIESNSDILYIGDHIYGDILKSKKTLGWRTMLVVPEIEHEIEVLNQNAGIPEKLFQMRRKRDGIEDQLQRMQWKFAEQENGLVEFPEADKKDMAKEMDLLRQEYLVLKEEHRMTLADFHKKFHQIWGQLLKTGYQNSRFANQIGRFACLYTSHVGNLRYYSPNKSYRGLQDEMPHDAIID